MEFFFSNNSWDFSGFFAISLPPRVVTPKSVNTIKSITNEITNEYLPNSSILNILKAHEIKAKAAIFEKNKKTNCTILFIVNLLYKLSDITPLPCN
jgi:hypothetical protein